MLDRQIQVKNKQIVICQDLSLSHAGTVWDGALCQIAFLNKNPDIAKQYIEGKSVLQLGSGTGILGLAACIYQPKMIYLTDMPDYLKLIQINRQKNLKVLNEQKIQILPLEWGNFDHIQKINNIDTIIGSELAYDKGCVQELMKTLEFYRKKNPDLKIMISYQKYKQEGRNIEVQFRKHFGNEAFRLVHWDKMDPDIRDQGIGIICA